MEPDREAWIAEQRARIQAELRRKLEIRNDWIMNSDDLECVIMRIVNRHDPIGIVYQSNLDEYRHEVEDILERLNKARSIVDVRHVIHRVFVRHFDPVLAGPEERYEALAREVWETWLQRWYASNP